MVMLRNTGNSVTADLLESLISSTCSALTVSITFSELIGNEGILLFPLLIIGSGIVASLFTMFFATHIVAIVEFSDLQRAIKYQNAIVAVLCTMILYAITVIGLPYELTVEGGAVIRNFDCFVCVATGLWSGFIMKNLLKYSDIEGVSSSFAIEALFNAAPSIFIATAIGIVYYFAGAYGVALAAVSFHSTACIDLSIENYGTISNSAYTLSVGEDIRKTIYELHSSINSNGAKGLELISAAFASTSLFFAFTTRLHLKLIDLLSFLQLCELVGGLMLPWIYGKAVGSGLKRVGSGMVEELRKELVKGQKAAVLGMEECFDISRCMQITVHNVFKLVLVCLCAVVAISLLCGLAFGTKGLADILVGSLIGGIQMAIIAVHNKTFLDVHIFIKIIAITSLTFAKKF
eukprot:TRINITY_DN12931_c0_g4_i1.p1 TRINITY_DN12931_c0_g4~~TRINITY_DN12931_c0_g4_i1.p1  ORF type:complete len:454 (+),score=46.65 TRINITY_DN12931_c0_g4_i1:148-1362(+)